MNSFFSSTTYSFNSEPCLVLVSTRHKLENNFLTIFGLFVSQATDLNYSELYSTLSASNSNYVKFFSPINDFFTNNLFGSFRNGFNCYTKWRQTVAYSFFKILIAKQTYVSSLQSSFLFWWIFRNCCQYFQLNIIRFKGWSCLSHFSSSSNLYKIFKYS